MPVYKIIIYYQIVKSKWYCFSLCACGVPTTYWRKPSIPPIWDCNKEWCKRRTDVKEFHEGFFLLKTAAWQRVIVSESTYVRLTSCRVAYPLGMRCRQPISDNCVKHVRPMTAHYWVAGWCQLKIKFILFLFQPSKSIKIFEVKISLDWYSNRPINIFEVKIS